MSEQEVFDYIYSVITKEYLENSIQKKEIFGITAKDIADHFNTYRSTVSTLLNTAVKNGLFIKIETRPVLFVPVDIVKRELHVSLDQSVYTPEEIRDLFFKKEQEGTDSFSIMIGYDGSQSLQIKQAQSAILYPPKGLHTLITGESGTGKTLFAHTMYDYGRKIKGMSEKEYPFVEFNCADYYHNPQLLLSQLFGHIRGAFTGADQETEGLVEKANHGILFLDEIHRLPPEGQELLFYLMDTGQYRKMGEANTIRKADILIIGATTENPKDVLLKTFKRRIPLTINLPPLRERPLQEKLKIMEHLFSKEAILTQRTYIIDADIIKAVSLYDFTENIGQLASEIKILCARSFLESKTKEFGEIKVPYVFLSDNIREAYKKYRKIGYTFTDNYENYNYDLVITPSNEITHVKENVLNEEAYCSLLDEIRNYSRQGLTSDEVAIRISSAVSSYYDEILNSMYFKTVNKDELYKIIEPRIVDFSLEVMKEIQNRLSVKITEQSILVLAFHLKFLIDRLRKIKLTESSSVPVKTGDTIVDDMIDKIESKFSLRLPTDEKKFFQLLIKNITSDIVPDNSSKAALYILAHGNTASSIAEVCNRLLHTDFVKAFDMPLTQDVNQSYQLFVEEIESLHLKKGVMILADMGSLLDFGHKLTRDTGIPTHTIPNVSTAIALDFAHIMLNRNEHIDLTYNEYLIKNRFEPAFASSEKEPAIISACSSGQGTSIAFKNMIIEILKENSLGYIHVFALSNEELQKKNEAYQEIMDSYNLVAVIGNVHIDVDAPFFHISELVTDDKKENFIKFLNKTGVSEQKTKHKKTDQSAEEAAGFLAQHVMYVNPLAVQKVATEFLEGLFDDLAYEEKNRASTGFSLIIHIGFMIERIIANKTIIFDHKIPYLDNNKEIFQKIRSHIKSIEEAFEIEISDDEICYMMITLYPNTYDAAVA
ncbi:sigma 54-interacting transcriptional regulator [[Clostridium] innocuum]|nr:sigma 54-interacting transcriptional regulator [Erysipelotrichaceae bacterium]MCR0382738.1 sigma 54-interacting transcriptional regulator [[Clostridium] innocuum]MCR0414655.1 sigma 54-interacting transcriptional regulator [[Clostridium] innocuum]MCR0535591.1 sigma 54-interacting transcriptional regulator [[Clostridium] innocuum]MDU1121392.1 sigma 54-interacting transcriptional regulator [Erysipelotrichaceae bacterium]